MSKNNKDNEPSKDAQNGFEAHPLPEKIGNSLKKIYNDVLNEPVPDDFLSLLAKADDKKKDS